MELQKFINAHDFDEQGERALRQCVEDIENTFNDKDIRVDFYFANNPYEHNDYKYQSQKYNNKIIKVDILYSNMSSKQATDLFWHDYIDKHIQFFYNRSLNYELYVDIKKQDN